MLQISTACQEFGSIKGQSSPIGGIICRIVSSDRDVDGVRGHTEFEAKSVQYTPLI